MSRNKKKKERKRDEILVLCLGLVFIALGVAAIVISNQSLTAYQRSDDVRQVEARVTYVERRSEPLTSQQKREKKKGNYVEPEPYYLAKVDYEVDGVGYKGQVRLKEATPVGSLVTVEVYRTGRGTYKIPKVRDPGGWSYERICGVIAIAVGAALSGMSVFLLLPDGGSGQKKTKKRS